MITQIKKNVTPNNIKRKSLLENGIPLVSFTGQTGAGKTTGIKIFVPKQYRKLISRLSGDIRSTLVPHIYDISSEVEADSLYISILAKDEPMPVDLFQELLLNGLVKLAVDSHNGKLEVNEENLFVKLKEAFLNPKKNDKAFFTLLTEENVNLVIKYIGDLLSEIGILSDLKSFYNRAIRTLPDGVKDSKIQPKLKEILREEIDNKFLMNKASMETYLRIFLEVSNFLKEKLWSYFEKEDLKSINIDEVYSKKLTFNHNGEPIDDATRKIVDGFFQDNNITSEKSAISPEALCHEIKLTLPMSDEIINIIEKNEKAHLLKHGAGYRFSIFDNKGAFHGEDDTLGNEELLREQMYRAPYDISFVFLSLENDFLKEDTKTVYKDLMSNFYLSRRTIFLFTKLDLFVNKEVAKLEKREEEEDIEFESHERAEIFKATLDEQMNLFITDVAKTAKTKNFDTFAYSSNSKSLKRISENTFNTYNNGEIAFAERLINELIGSIKQRETVNVYSLLDLESSIHVDIQNDEVRKILKLQLDTHFDHHEYKKLDIQSELNKQKGRTPHLNSWYAIAYYVSWCEKFKSKLQKGWFVNCEDIDVSFLASLPTMLSHEIIQEMRQIFLKNVVVIESSESQKLDIERVLAEVNINLNLASKKILGSIASMYYSKANKYFSPKSKYKSFIDDIEKLVTLTPEDEVLEEIAEASLQFFNEDIDRTISIVLR